MANISSITLPNNSNYDIRAKKIFYADCSTARNVIGKIITCKEFVLETGAIIVIRFTNTGTSNPTSGKITLNINNTGAKNIVSKDNNSVYTYSVSSLFCNNQTLIFIYNGTNFVHLNRDNNTVYTLPKATTSVLGGVKVDGSTINVDDNGVISAVGGSDDWTNVGTVAVASKYVSTEVSIPNLSNYKFMMLSISTEHYYNSKYEAHNYTQIFVLDDYKPSSNWDGPFYYIGNDVYYTSINTSNVMSNAVYPEIGSMTIDKSTNKVKFYGRHDFYANIYMR